MSKKEVRKSAHEPAPEAHQGPVAMAEGIAPLAAPAVPSAYTQTRTLTVAVYTAVTGYLPPMYFVTEGSYNAFHGSADGVRQDMLNRLSPPPAASGSG